MELVARESNIISFHRGLLNSVYKEEITYGFRNLKEKSIFKLKERAMRNRERLCSSSVAILKISMFVIALGMIIF